MANPVVRKADVMTQEVGDELVVYDAQRSFGYTLNRTASLVYSNADGTRSVADLAKILQDEHSDQADEDLVQVTLDELNRKGLLDDGEDRPAAARRASRRRFFRKVGMIGSLTLLLPAIETTLAPTPAMAHSGRGCDGCQTQYSCGCEYSCDSGCHSGCQSGCYSGCQSGCYSGCYSGCQSGCYSGCFSGCFSGCQSGCYSGCFSGCFGGDR